MSRRWIHRGSYPPPGTKEVSYVYNINVSTAGSTRQG
jgi:hypothetical protein